MNAFRSEHAHLFGARRLDDLKPVTVAEAGKVDLCRTIRLEVLAEVHCELDALGGYFDPRDERACGRDERLSECLAVVERMMDEPPGAPAAAVNDRRAA